MPWKLFLQFFLLSGKGEVARSRYHRDAGGVLPITRS